MKVENDTTGHNRFLRFTGLPGEVSELVVEVKYRDPRRSDGENAYLLDLHVIPAIIEAINNYKPKPKRDPKWPVMAKAAVAAVARRMEIFTPDDVWEEMAGTGVEGGDPRSLGGIMDACATEGIIERTEETMKSRRRERHGGSVRVWTSLVVKGRSSK